jgi:hypothetical protein
MKILTNKIMEQLLINGETNNKRIAEDGRTMDFHPVVKLFFPFGNFTWLITEIDPQNPDIMFGLADLGQGCPEMGSISLSELLSVKGQFGLGLERDIHFEAEFPLSVYAKTATELGRIVTHPSLIKKEAA